MSKCKDVTEWQKGAILFSCAYGRMVSEVAGFVGVSQQIVQQVYKQWCMWPQNTSELWLEKHPDQEGSEMSFMLVNKNYF